MGLANKGKPVKVWTLEVRITDPKGKRHEVAKRYAPAEMQNTQIGFRGFARECFGVLVDELMSEIFAMDVWGKQ